MKKVLALDLDGTLTNSEKKITTKTREAIRKMQEAGHILVLASGRPTPGVSPLAEELELAKYGGYTLSYNGARMIDCKTGETIVKRTLPQDLVAEIFELAEELKIGIMTYNEKGIVAGSIQDEYMELEAFINHLEIRHFENPMEMVTEPVSKCLGTAPEELAPEIEERFREKFGDWITVDRSEPFFIELLPKGVGKAHSLALLVDRLGLTREDVIACGDGFNDVGMIEYAGLGVAMANAQKPVKEVADLVTLSNDEDGVAKVIEEYILKENP